MSSAVSVATPVVGPVGVPHAAHRRIRRPAGALPGIALILARRNGVAISSGTERMNLELDDTVLIHGQAELTLTAAQATVFVIEIERTA